HWRRKNSGMVSRARGMGSARIGKSQHRGRRTQTRDEGSAESENQTSRNLPAVCPVDLGRSSGRVVCGIASVAVYDDGLFGASGEKRENSCADACRRNGPPAYGNENGEPAVLEIN